MDRKGKKRPFCADFDRREKSDGCGTERIVYTMQPDKANGPAKCGRSQKPHNSER